MDKDGAAETPTEAFGMMVKAVRDDLRMTQAEAVALVDEQAGLKYDVPAWSKLEKGRRSLKYDEAARIADVFGFSLDVRSWVGSGRVPVTSEWLLKRMRTRLESLQHLERTAAGVRDGAAAQVRDMERKLAELEAEVADGEHQEAPER